MVDPAADRALYRQVADDLRRRIQSGQYPVGSPIPAEKDLSYEYDVSGLTLRRALDVLVAEGLIVKRAGALTRVREAPQREIVPVSTAEHFIGGRGATEAEAAEWGVIVGSPVLVLVERVSGIAVEAWPADRTLLDPSG